MKIEGMDQVERNMEAYVKAMKSNSKEAVENTTQRIYDRAHQVVPVLTGELQSSLSQEVRELMEGVHEGYVSANTDYAEIVERRQPYLKPSLDEQGVVLEQEIAQAHNKSTQEVK